MRCCGDVKGTCAGGVRGAGIGEAVCCTCVEGGMVMLERVRWGGVDGRKVTGVVESGRGSGAYNGR